VTEYSHPIAPQVVRVRLRSPAEPKQLDAEEWQFEGAAGAIE
jgi:hypothetical protein